MATKTTATKAYKAGLQVRRAVLGRAYVDGSIKNADDFSRPLQNFVTEYCWGGVWTRPHLTRSPKRRRLKHPTLSHLQRPRPPSPQCRQHRSNRHRRLRPQLPLRPQALLLLGHRRSVCHARSLPAPHRSACESHG